MVMKLAGASGLLIIGLLQALFGLHLAILWCVVLFFIAWLISRNVNQLRGEAAAAEQTNGVAYSGTT
jgi:UMF1 family MFS transporter